MMINKILITLLTCFLTSGVEAQVLYVNGATGSDAAKGTVKEPLATLTKAVFIANSFNDTEQVTIKLAPGYYLLKDQLRIESKNGPASKPDYTLEAITMPDDQHWKPDSMPVIGSVSLNNDKKYFDHCAGIMVARENVVIRGLKFLGNPDPSVPYYYPIVRDTTTLNRLDISQCYFIGDRNGTPVQGAIYAEGPGIHVDHCIFYGCKNAVLVFQYVRDFSVTHTIVYGAYECAFWYNYTDPGEPDQPFEFSNNIVSHCHYFWAGTPSHDHSADIFRNSLICGNDHYVGTQNGQGGVMALNAHPSYREISIIKTGTVQLAEVQLEELPHDHLNLLPGSDGKNTGAGIFKK